jgi:hypothetical protein
MDSARLQEQQEIDREIVGYVREMQRLAPVTAESAHSFLTQHRRRRLTRARVDDRLQYLVGAGDLERHREWVSGSTLEHFTVTALGMDRQDGEAPPRNWRP